MLSDWVDSLAQDCTRIVVRSCKRGKEISSHKMHMA